MGVCGFLESIHALHRLSQYLLQIFFELNFLARLVDQRGFRVEVYWGYLEESADIVAELS